VQVSESPSADCVHVICEPVLLLDWPAAGLVDVLLLSGAAVVTTGLSCTCPCPPAGCDVTGAREGATLGITLAAALGAVPEL
jgi:hypothetical protein